MRLLTQVSFKSRRKAAFEFSLSALSDAHRSNKTNVGTLAQARAEARRALSVAKRDVDIYLFYLCMPALCPPWWHSRTDFPVHWFVMQHERSRPHFQQAIMVT